jgi:hypothetical protein
MICSQVTIVGAGGATHQLIFNVYKAFPWSADGAVAVANVSSFLAGTEVLGYKLDMSQLTGWDVLDVQWNESTSQLIVNLKEVGSPIPVGVAAAIIIILILLGLIIYAWSFATIAGDVLKTVDTKLRADCIKSYIDSGKTPEEALTLCPEKSVGTDWGTITLIGVGILGLAYVLGGKK